MFSCYEPHALVCSFHRAVQRNLLVSSSSRGLRAASKRFRHRWASNEGVVIQGTLECFIHLLLVVYHVDEGAVESEQEAIENFLKRSAAEVCGHMVPRHQVQNAINRVLGYNPTTLILVHVPPSSIHLVSHR